MLAFSALIVVILFVMGIGGIVLAIAPDEDEDDGVWKVIKETEFTDAYGNTKKAEIVQHSVTKETKTVFVE